MKITFLARQLYQILPPITLLCGTPHMVNFPTIFLQFLLHCNYFEEISAHNEVTQDIESKQREYQSMKNKKNDHCIFLPHGLYHPNDGFELGNLAFSNYHFRCQLGPYGSSCPRVVTSLVENSFMFKLFFSTFLFGLRSSMVPYDSSTYLRIIKVVGSKTQFKPRILERVHAHKILGTMETIAIKTSKVLETHTFGLIWMFQNSF